MVSVTKYFVSLGAVIVTVGEGVVPVGDSAQGSRVFAMLPQQAHEVRLLGDEDPLATRDHGLQQRGTRPARAGDEEVPLGGHGFSLTQVTPLCRSNPQQGSGYAGDPRWCDR